MIDNSKVSNIPCRLHNVGEGGITGADEVIDDEKGKSQQQINAEVDQTLGAGGSVDERIAAAVAPKANSADVYAKTETYNKTELNNIITTPEVNYVNVEATDQTTSISDVLPATGAANTIYKIGNWDGTQYDTSKYTEYAWNGSVYIPLATRDHGVDDEPTAESNNLVKSGGVQKSQMEIIKELSVVTGKYDVLATYGFSVDGYFNTSESSVHGILAVTAGDRYVIENSDGRYANYAFATSDAYEPGGAVPLVNGTSVGNVPIASSIVLTIPEGCNYLLINQITKITLYKYYGKIADLDKTITGDSFIVSNLFTVSSGQGYTIIKVKPNTLYKVTIPRVVAGNYALRLSVYDSNDKSNRIAQLNIPTSDTSQNFDFHVYSKTGNLYFYLTLSSAKNVSIRFENVNYLLNTYGKGDFAKYLDISGENDGTKLSLSTISFNGLASGRYRYKVESENIRNFAITKTGARETYIPNENGEGLIDLSSDWIENIESVRAYVSDSTKEAKFSLYLYKVPNESSLEDVAEIALDLKTNSVQPVSSNAVLKVSPVVIIPITTKAGTYVDTKINAISPNTIYKIFFPKVPYTNGSKNYKAYMTLYDESTSDYCAYIRILDEDKDEYYTYICAETGNIVLRVYSDTQQNINVRFEAVECFDFKGNTPFKGFTPYSKSDTISSKIIYNKGFQSLTSGKHFFKVFNSDILRQIRPIAGTRLYPALVYDENGEGVINITEEMISGSENELVTSLRFYYKDRTTPTDFTAALIIFNGEVEETEDNSNIFELYKNEEFSSKVRTLKKKTPFRDDATHTPIVLLWFSDLHGNLNTLNGMMAWYNAYKEYIDDTINCGDTVTDSLIQYDSVMEDYFENISDIPNKLIVGNHDVIGSDNIVTSIGYRYWAALGDYSIKNIYDMFTDKLDLSGCVQPTDASTYGYNFYYKDYDNGSTKLRLIFLDTAITTDAIDYYIEHKGNDDPVPDSSLVAATEAYETAQKQWLSDVLSDAITEQIPVAIATHCPPTSKDFNMGNSFATFGGENLLPNAYGRISDDYLDMVQNDFINNNGEFVCWLSGHVHQDRIGLTTRHSQLSVVINTATSRRSNVSSFNPLRLENTETQYAFNHIAFDTRLKRITLLRVGCNYDLYGRKKDILVVDYNEKKPFDEVFALTDNNE